MIYNENEIYYKQCPKCGCYLDIDELCEDCDIRRNDDIYKTVSEGDEKDMYTGHTSNNFVCIEDVTGKATALNKVIYNPLQTKEFNKTQLLEFCNDKKINLTDDVIEELLNSDVDSFIQKLHLYYLKKIYG